MQAETPGKDHVLVISAEERDQGKLLPESFRVAGLLLHARGYVVLKGAIPRDVAEQAQEAFAEVYRDCRASKQGDGWYQVARQTQAVFWERNCRWRIFPWLRSPFDSPWLLANPFAMELLQFLLGAGFYCKFVSSDTCTKGAILQSPHRELGAGQLWGPPGYIINIPLGRCGLDNGPLEVWPGGGHLWRNEVLEQLRLGTDVQDGRNPDIEWFATLFPSRRLELELGDVLIRDPGLLHRGTVNHTDERRSMLTVCYFRQGQTHDYGQVDYNLDRELWQQLDPRVQALFAHAFPPSPPQAGFWQRLRLPWSRRWPA